MKTTELRIGNLVLDRGGKILKVDWLERTKACMEMFIGVMEVHPLTEDFEYIQPIPLTEEWLLKFGFVKIKHQFNMNDGSLCEHWELNGNDQRWLLYYSTQNFAFNEPKLHNLYLRHNKYVHQLQNLYFALTGNELEIK